MDAIAKTFPDFSHEVALLEAGSEIVVGIDEAGRGPWAGPVVAGAAWINPEAVNLLPKGIDDSKKLSPAERANLWQALLALAEDSSCLKVATAFISASKIDEIGILPATFKAMEEAYLKLNLDNSNALHVLVDGTLKPPFSSLASAQITPLKKGDSRSLSIAVAAIAAKQTRDAYMQKIDTEYLAYGWKSNMGYGTKKHAQALEQYGPCPHHRLSFKPVALVANKHHYTR